MKLLTNKKYNELKDAPLELKQKLKEKQEKLEKANRKISELEYGLADANTKKNNFETELEKKSLEIIKQKNKLDLKDDEITKLKQKHSEEKSEFKNKIKELNNRIEDLESDRYLRKECPPDKPKKQKIGIKRGTSLQSVKQVLKGNNKIEKAVEEGV